jgi:hypothetical protein
VSQDGPADTRHFIRQGDDSLIPTSLFTDTIDPAAQWIIFVGRLKNNGPRSVNQLRTKIFVPTLAYA